MRFKRVCLKCLKEFRPNGKFQKICNECQKNIKNENFIKMLLVRKLRYIKI